MSFAGHRIRRHIMFQICSLHFQSTPSAWKPSPRHHHSVLASTKTVLPHEDGSHLLHLHSLIQSNTDRHLLHARHSSGTQGDSMASLWPPPELVSSHLPMNLPIALLTSHYTLLPIPFPSLKAGTISYESWHFWHLTQRRLFLRIY